MHTYSINAPEHKSVPFILAGVSIVIIFGLKLYIPVPDWVPVPSAFALYTILFLAFDKWIWRWPIVQKTGAIITPDLNGSWEFLSKSSMTDYAIQYTGSLEITQTWTNISIIMAGEKANSKSVMAGIEIHTSKNFTLKWEYLSQPKAQFNMDAMHYGMTRVQTENRNGVIHLEGDYYTDKSRHNFGSVTMYKKEKA